MTGVTTVIHNRKKNISLSYILHIYMFGKYMHNMHVLRQQYTYIYIYKCIYIYIL